MTVASCLATCEGLGMGYAGLEYGSECHCGTFLDNGASLSSSSSSCNMACSGNLSTLCGGSNALQFYTKTIVVPSVNNYAYVGCITEVSGRALAATSEIDYTSMTIDKCTSFCSAGGYSLAGLEWYGECYCANKLSSAATTAKFSYQCNTPCAGNSTQNCGGPDAIALYSL